MLLQMLGHEVRTALDGATALYIAREFSPQLVLCDIGLPGMAGYEVLRRLREQSGDAMPVVVALTGYGQAEDRKRTEAAGFDHHVVKPVDPDSLENLIEMEADRLRSLG